ncbi:hypothetical protein LCGC14_1393900 [marine sediment metagenome]|uniref:Uncharacterized protein n=1 Tax=marine sediment metagenome TaxID=412755 RepID=A0A0F9JZA9_9ZZZZ
MPQLVGPQYTASESITVSTVAVGLTDATFETRTHAHITCEDNPVRYWLDGTSPTATVGHRLEVGGVLDLDSHHQLVNVLFIAVGADGVLRASYGEG